MTLDTQIEGEHLIDILLTPTKIYVKTFKKLKDKINALAHITGGGIVENLPRMLPDNLNAVVKKDDTRVLEIFKYMSHHVEEDEMYRTFNMGVGMVLVVDPTNLQDVLDGSDGYVIGEVTKGDGSVSMV
jgi:phosphoribosylformylglycinamidine cyclo-ligase